MPTIPDSLKDFYDNYFLTTPPRLWHLSSFKTYCKTTARPPDTPDQSNLRYHFHACLNAIIHQKPPFQSSSVFRHPPSVSAKQDCVLTIARNICYRLRQQNEERNTRKRKRIPFKMETNVQPTVHLSNTSRGESSLSIGGVVSVNIHPTTSVSEEQDTVSRLQRKSRKRARHDRSSEGEDSDEQNIDARAEASDDGSPGPSTRESATAHRPQPSISITQPETNLDQEEQPPEYEKLSHNEEDDDDQSFHTPAAHTPVATVWALDEPIDDNVDVAAPSPDAQPSNDHTDATLESTLSRTQPAPSTNADPSPTHPPRRPDIILPSSGRRLALAVADYVASLAEEDKKDLEQWITQADKFVYFPGKPEALLDEILSPEETAYLLSKTVSLPPITTEFEAILSAHLKLVDSKAGNWLPAVIKPPAGSEDWRTDTWDMWYYVQLAMRYFSRYLSKFTAEKKDHSEGWWDANVWSFVFDHAYHSSEILTLER